jgi:hypothetical protein
MAVNLSPVGGVAAQFFNNNGVILSGGKIFTYASGTTTNQATYTSSSGAIAHTNPIILDSAGRVPSGEIWLTDGVSYKFVFTDSNDVLIGTYDNINGINSTIANFTTEQEFQTATAGQTVFNLTTMEYQPATNSLSVFVDGVNQYGPGAQYSYVETDSNTVTFNAGLHVGAEVKFTTSNINSTAGGAAAGVSFTGFKGQTGNVQDIADDDGSDWIGFEPVGASVVARSVEDKLRETISVADYPDLQTAIATAKLENKSVSIYSDTTINIPSDALSLQDVFDHTYTENTTIKITVNIQTGHDLTSGLKLEGVFKSNYEIVSADAVVYLDNNFSGVSNIGTDSGSSFENTNNLFVFIDTSIPKISTLFDMNSPRGVNRLGMGFQAVASNGYISTGCGVINAGMCGCYTQNTRLYAIGSVWDNAGSEGLRVQQVSSVTAQAASAKNCQIDPVAAASNSAVFCSRGSSLHFTDGDASGSNRWGVDSHRAWLSATNANFSGATTRGANCQLGGRLILTDADISNCGELALRLTENALVDAQGADLSGAGTNSVRLDDTGNILNLNGAKTNSSIGFTPVIADVTNVPAFNVPIPNGIVFGPTNNLDLNVFSDTGASNGKTFANGSSVLDSSRNATSAQLHQRFYNANGQVGNISTSGTGTSYAVTSNEDYKNFIGEYDAQKAIDIIKSDPVRDWNWTPEKGGGYAVGWGAQTSYTVSPDLATKGGWYLNGEEVAPGTEDAEYVEWGVDQGKRTPYLWAAVSYLIDEVKTLRAMLDDKK